MENKEGSSNAVSIIGEVVTGIIYVIFVGAILGLFRERETIEYTVQGPKSKSVQVAGLIFDIYAFDHAMIQDKTLIVTLRNGTVLKSECDSRMNAQNALAFLQSERYAVS